MNFQSPTVSVIIPCYNQGQYITEAVNSVLSQTYQHFEIIIINDGSTELETIEMLKNYNQPKTTIIHTNNQGVSEARNHAIKVAKGKYILPLDADDKIGSKYLEEAVKLLEANEKLGIVYCEAEFFGEKTGKWNLPEYQFPEILLENVIFCSGFFRKADWQRTGGYSSNMIYWEDYDFWLSIIELDREVYRLPQVFFFYRKHPGSTIDLMERQNYINSYSKLFKNHSELYHKNISILFAEIVDSKANRQQLQLEVERSQSQIQELQMELEQSQFQIQQLQMELERSQQIIQEIENSKFWKLRKIWLQFKQIIWLKKEK